MMAAQTSGYSNCNPLEPFITYHPLDLKQKWLSALPYATFGDPCAAMSVDGMGSARSLDHVFTGFHRR